MKKTLLVFIVALMISNAAMADHIGIYSDEATHSCNLGAAGFNSTAVIIHEFATGATGSRFKMPLPAGSTFLTFSTTYTTVGLLTSDLSVAYGTCASGSFVLGNLVAILTAGYVQVQAADAQLEIIYADCSFNEHPASGGLAFIGQPGGCPEPVEPATWGKVKALYR